VRDGWWSRGFAPGPGPFRTGRAGQPRVRAKFSRWGVETRVIERGSQPVPPAPRLRRPVGTDVFFGACAFRCLILALPCAHPLAIGLPVFPCALENFLAIGFPPFALFLWEFLPISRLPFAVVFPTPVGIFVRHFQPQCIFPICGWASAATRYRPGIVTTSRGGDERLFALRAPAASSTRIRPPS
jgi:hypothetical protein